jgi:hypothetical protein
MNLLPKKLECDESFVIGKFSFFFFCFSLNYVPAISYCSKGKRVCQGQPCYVPSTTATPVMIRTTAVPVSNTTIPEMGISTCRTGWSQWINTHHPKEGGDRNDIEPIPDRLNPVI